MHTVLDIYIVTESTCCKAIYAYTALESNEISFVEQDIITNINEIDEGWWQGEINGMTGVFPANHVEKIN